MGSSLFYDLQDKSSIIQVLGSIMTQPSLLESSIKLEVSDFPEQLHKITFGVINNIYETSNTNSIEPIDVEGFLSNYKQQLNVFIEHGGQEFLETAISLANISNYEYHISRIKKYSLLREMYRLGFDIEEYHSTNLDPFETEQSQKRFDEATLSEILDHYDHKLESVKFKYNTNESVTENHIGANVRKTYTNLLENPDFGAPFQGLYFNTITRGARSRRLYVRSLPSGEGKTRWAIADMGHMSFPAYFDTTTQQWYRNTMTKPSLFITTELPEDEIHTMCLAYIAGVNEEHLLNGRLGEVERYRFNQAVRLLENQKETPVHLVYMPDFTISGLSAVIKKYIRDYGVENVFFDYIHSTASTLAELSERSKVIAREDQILTLMASQLKQIATDNGVFLMSATQLNSSGEISSARAIKNALDFYMSARKVDMGDIELIDSICEERPDITRPNYVGYVEKVRRGSHDNVKIWSHIDFGTMKIKDCFVTDMRNQLLHDVQQTKIESHVEMSDEEFTAYMETVGGVDG